MRVLIVEDNQAQAAIARRGLELRGLDVDCTQTLQEALSRLGEPGIDSILLDLSLPDSDGIETFHAVSAAAGNIPIVVFSGLDNQEVALASLKSGAQDYLIKGRASDDSVARCLRYAVEKAQAEAALVRSEKRLRIIMENSYSAFISMDANWRIRDWNKLAEVTFGRKRSEVIGQGLSLIVPRHLRKQYAREVADFFGQHKDKVLRLNSEIIGIHSDGHEFPIEITIFRIKEEGSYSYCAFARDISERKQAEEVLERRVQERTEELTRSNEELKQFAKIASHDLQEPLRAIQGFATLLAESTSGKLDKDAQEFIEYILDGTQRMQQLIQAVLLHSSIKHDEPVEVATDCNSVIEEVLANLDASIKEAGAHFEVDNLPEVAVDRWQLIQLFQNLISNAIKYRSKDVPKIHLTAEQSVNEWLFSVRDNGIGMDSGYVDKIFDMFARLHKKTEYTGTGMGLAICKKIVTTHGGKIWVESKAGQGSIFLFTLPAVMRPQLRRKAMEEGIEILLVEDSPSDVRLTQEALKRSDLKCTMSVVNDGVEAMEYLNQVKNDKNKRLPDIILLDLNMPRKNGHEVLQEIKDDPQLRKIAVVLLTVSQRDEDVMEALKLKMNYYLAKPVTSQKLSVLIKSICELQSEEPGDQKHSDEETHVRLVLAGNPHTSASILSKLAQDQNPRVRARVAENKETPEEVLKLLSEDDNPDVRLGVSENVSAPEVLLQKLAADLSEDVRLGIASNPKIPSKILSLLENDQNMFVASEAKSTLSKLTHHN